MGDPHYRLRFQGRDYTATDLSALVLRRLKEDAEANSDEALWSRSRDFDWGD